MPLARHRLGAAAECLFRYLILLEANALLILLLGVAKWDVRIHRVYECVQHQVFRECEIVGSLVLRQ